MVPLTDDGMTPAADAPQETTMFTKTLIAALVLTGVSLTFVADASAGPTKALPQAEQNYFDRASNGGHHAGDTNGN
jgi:acetoin utilization deacetylase AcuC-like enzyme